MENKRVKPNNTKTDTGLQSADGNQNQSVMKNRRVKPEDMTPAPGSQPAINNPLELHACMGLNACRGHDVFGTNECAGMGQCATQMHYCHTLNNCRGQGGCGLYGSTEEQCKPGQNDCAFQGSCGTPIPASRYVTQGPNKGQSVWQIARQLFVERMTKARRNVGPSPMRYGPTLEFLKTIKPLNGSSEGSSCGYSGEKFCSFAGNTQATNDPAARKNRTDFERESARNLQQSIDNCDCQED